MNTTTERTFGYYLPHEGIKNFLHDKIAIIEGMACLGKTTYLKEKAAQGRRVYVIDFQEQLNVLDERDSPMKKVLLKKHSNSAYGGLYSSFLSTRCMEICIMAQRNLPGNVTYVDRWTLSDTFYNMLLAYEGDVTAIKITMEEDGVIDALKMTVLCKDFITIYVSSDVELVKKRMRERNTELDRHFLDEIEWDYVGAQLELWTWIAEKLEIKLVDVKDKFIAQVE